VNLRAKVSKPLIAGWNATRPEGLTAFSVPGQEVHRDLAGPGKPGPYADTARSL